MCKCVQELNERLRKAGYENARLIDSAFIITDTDLKYYTTSTIRYENGVNKNGKIKYKEMPVTHSNCPFCGEKYLI